MYKPTDKICELMAGSNTPNSKQAENQALQLVQRFGIPLGVGDKTIAQVCKEVEIDCTTMLAVINFAISQEYQYTPDIDIPTLRKYLSSAHNYFIDFQLPRIRQMLLEAINLTGAGNKIPLLIIQFYDEYVEEIRAHIQHEDEYAFEHHPTEDRHVAAKAIELKNLIIKYYPHSNKSPEQDHLLYAVLHDLYHFERELALHCAIEDEIMLPALKATTYPNITGDENINLDGGDANNLSSREKEVLIKIADGLSNKEIADALCLSTHTVMSHRKNIARKLNIHSTAGLTIYAIVNGIVALKSMSATS